MQVIRPFGPTIGKVSIPNDIVKNLNDYVDEILQNEKKSNQLNYGNKLAGNVKQEFLLEREFTVLSGWENFLKTNAEKWIMETIKKKIQEFKIVDSWIVRQFENEYNPLHSHGGHISGVGYLKVPDDFGKTVQDNKDENYNGDLQLVPVSYTHLTLPTKRIV